MKTFDNLKEFTYIGNKVIVDGEEYTINTPCPAISSEVDTELYAVQFHRGRTMIEETKLGNVSVATVTYQQALTAWNNAKELHDNPQYTAEELYLQEVSKWKASRGLLVKRLEVSHNDVIYQADETSRGRMAVAIAGMNDGDTQKWTAKDNSVHLLAEADLKAIIKAGNDTQTEIWNNGRP